jgi:hypothetical protein
MPGRDPVIVDYVIDGITMRIKANGKAWAAKNYKSLWNEMQHQHDHMVNRAKEMGLPALTYTYAKGRDNIAGLLGHLAGNSPIKPPTYPGVEGEDYTFPKPPKPKKRWFTYESSSPKSRGILSKAFHRKKSPLKIL